MASWISNAGLALARAMPRGGFRIVRTLASMDTSLQRHPVSLTLLPNATIPADLRESVWYPLWRFGHYPHQLAEDQFALRLLRGGEVVWDIGANIGYTAAIFVARVGTQGRVISVEPGRKAFAMLQRSVSGCANVTCVQAAVSDKEGTLTFADSEKLDTSHVSENPSSGYSVRCTTLDHLLEETGCCPYFLKIDVEGHESQAFAGGSRLFGESPPIVEFEALSDDAFEENRALLAQLSRGAYEFRRFDHNGRLLSPGGAPATRWTNNYIAFTAAQRDRVMAAESAA